MLALLGRPEKSIDRHIDDSPRPALVLSIRLPLAQRFRLRQIRAFLSHDLQVSFDRLASIVEGFLNSVAGAEAARKIRHGDAEGALAITRSGPAC
jgi:hypothetical protein